MKRRFFLVPLLYALLLGTMCLAVHAAQGEPVDWESLYTYGDVSAENTKISVQRVDGEAYLFLPSNADLSALPLHLSISDPSTLVTIGGSLGAVPLEQETRVDLTALCTGSPYTLTLRAQWAGGSSEETLTVVTSSNVSAMYLVSDDPVNQGRKWVESSPDKENKATGAMVLQNEDGSLVYDGSLTQIKGRGNSTWKLDKKPYQIKLDKKTDLLETGEKDNKAKTWVLLANYADPALLRNTLALNLGAEMGMDFNMENRPVDLYYDGEYRGAYLLTEKVEVNSGRVDITDLEGANEDANSGIDDLTELSTEVGRTENGATYTYCVGMENPEDISGGYLLEMEVAYRTATEICYFYTTRGNYVVVKSPECCSQAEMDYIATLYQEYEDALFNDGVNPDTGKRYTDYVDLESTVQCYLINELTKNLDGFRTSAYLYKEAGVDQMKMGPLWDYDLGFGMGAGTEVHAQEQRNPEGLYTARSIFAGALYRQPDFRVAVKAAYEESLYPLLENVVLGDEAAVSGSLHSIAWYRSQLQDSAAGDYILWRGKDVSVWSKRVDTLTDYIRIRSQWLKEAFGTWNGETCEPLSIYLDVATDKWYYDEIMAVTQYGLMRGVAQSTFSPETIATRAQIVQTIYNMEQPEPVPFEQTFSDVHVNSWYGTVVNWGVKAGIVSGYPDGTFRPDKGITRQELVTLLYRYAGSPAVNGTALEGFADGDKVFPFAREAMEWAAEEGLIQGYPEDNTIRPLKTTTRAELAAILLRYYEGFALNN